MLCFSCLDFDCTRQGNAYAVVHLSAADLKQQATQITNRFSQIITSVTICLVDRASTGSCAELLSEPQRSRDLSSEWLMWATKSSMLYWLTGSHLIYMTLWTLSCTFLLLQQTWSWLVILFLWWMTSVRTQKPSTAANRFPMKLKLNKLAEGCCSWIW